MGQKKIFSMFACAIIKNKPRKRLFIDFVSKVHIYLAKIKLPTEYFICTKVTDQRIYRKSKYHMARNVDNQIVKGGSISKNVVQTLIAKTVQTSDFVQLNLQFK